MDSMDLDPDVAVPSIETNGQVKDSAATTTTTPRSERYRNVNVNVNGTSPSASPSVSSRTTPNKRQTSTPSQTLFQTPRSRAATPSASSISRSPSVASVRHDRSTTPKLDRKRSVPNLTVRSATPSQPQFRRASSNLNPLTPVKSRGGERQTMTPASVAKDYFQKELHTHTRSSSKVVVFTHDACYGHRFSRPRATKAMLGSIVERPERIHATLLGATTAYVRLGDRHKDGKHTPHPNRELPVPPFSIIKSTRSVPLNHPAVTSVHGSKWMESLQVMCDSAEAKLAVGQKELARPIGYTKDSKGNTLPALHSGDLYLASESLDALQGCLGGICDAVDTVFQPDANTRRAFVCIRPPGHHCSAEMPSGFCWLNNVHVGISYAAMNHGLTHAAIIDFDLHHGDGSQTITWEHNSYANLSQNAKSTPAHKKVPIGYYSLHDINSYPCEYGDDEKVRNASTCLHTAHGQSIWNVHLESWKTHADFWHLYETKYRVLLDKAQSFLQHHSDALRKSGIEPKAAIFLSSGFDASEWEGEGMQRHQVNVPTDFYATFTADVVDIAQKPDLGVDGRVISALEGGYSDRALTSGVLSHLCGLAQDSEINTTEDVLPGLNNLALESKYTATVSYDPAWWHKDQLEILEAMVTGNLPPPPKSKDKLPNSYSSPTHASTARMTDTAKERRSINAQIEARMAFENAPPEPVPEVDWVTAAYELSRLLIPVDRQTLSCTHEELNAENSRARKDRQSLGGIQTSDIIDEKMQLRDRRPKQVNLSTAPPRASSRTTNRRTTIAAASELPDPDMQEVTRTRRRSSAASSVLSGFHDMRLDNADDFSNTRETSRTASAAPQKPEMPMPVKKTRAPVRKPTSRPTSPRKAKAQPSIPSRTSSGDTSRASTTNGTAIAPRTDGVDELTSGMKKISIKLKMPTEDQHAANLRRTEEPQPTAPKTKPTRKPAVPRAPKVKAGASTKATPASTSSTKSTNAPPLQPAADSNNPYRTAPVIASQPKTTNGTQPTFTVQPQQPIQYTESNPQTSTATSTLKFEPPQLPAAPDQTSAPSPPVNSQPQLSSKTEAMPTYTTTSTNSSFQHHNQQHHSQYAQDNINEISYPSIKMSQSQSMSPPPNLFLESTTDINTSDTVQNHTTAVKKEPTNGDNTTSIYDVPETPRH